MEKTMKIIAAFLLLIAAIMAVLVISNVISLHEIPVTLAKLFRNDKAETSSEGTDPHVKVDDVENVLKDIADAINKVANNQEAMTSAVAQLTVNLDTSNETFHKEVIALLESKGLNCCCCQCTGEKAPETHTCTHSSTKYTIGDGVHYTKCVNCAKILATASCKYNSNGYCYTCGGYRKSTETQAPETTLSCNHTNTTLRASAGSTHVVVCKECNFTVKTENCIYANNGYCNCGNACAHNSKYTEAAANGTHNLKCGICHLTIMNEKCIFVNGVCVCTNACLHANTYQRPNGNETHSLICTECGNITNTVECSLNTGACNCGTLCKHAKTNVVSNNNGTHAEKCVICNYTVKTVNCVYANNACACGHVKVQTPTPISCNLKYIAVEGRNVHGVRCLNHVNEQYEEACTLVNNRCTKCGGYYSAANRIPTSGSNDSEIVPGSGNNDSNIVPGSNGSNSSKCNLRYVAIPGRDIHMTRCTSHVNEQYTESCTYKNGCCTKCAGAKQCDDDTVPGSGSSDNIVPGSGSSDNIVPGSGSSDNIVPGSGSSDDIVPGSGLFGKFGNPF